MGVIHTWGSYIHGGHTYMGVIHTWGSRKLPTLNELELFCFLRSILTDVYMYICQYTIGKYMSGAIYVYMEIYVSTYVYMQIKVWSYFLESMSIHVCVHVYIHIVHINFSTYA